MTQSKFQVVRIILLISLLILVWVVGKSPAAYAAQAGEATLDAVQDSYTDINAETSNFDEGLLTAANSPGPLEADDVTTKQIFLEFDLSAVDFEIKSAILSLSTLTCEGSVPVDVVDIAVYGIDSTSSWDEATLSWQNQPDLSTGVLATLDAGSTNFNSAQLYTWTDAAQGDLANWLETQRNASAKSASLVLVVDKTDSPGLANIFFEDSEGTGAAYGCSDATDGPILKLSDQVTMYAIFLPVLIH